MGEAHYGRGCGSPDAGRPVGGGLVHFIAPLVAAAAPVDGQAGVDAAPADDAPDMPPASAAVDGTVVPQPGRAAAEELRRMLRVRIGHAPWLGSNGMAFGEAVTGEGQSVLFGNPHWYWSGPDRFYQMHLTIPGTLNVAGAGFLGVPLVMVGFNEQVAWTHTVSTRAGQPVCPAAGGRKTRALPGGRGAATPVAA